MKKILSVLIAALLAFAAVPAFAEGTEGSMFDTAFTLVENEPEVEYDEWDIPYNVWVPAQNTELTVGETATVTLTYSVPEAAVLSDFTERQLANIEYLVNITGLENIELVEAQNCPQKMDCDYDAGICLPVPGEYANITMTETGCTVMAELNKAVVIVLRGTVAAETLNCSAEINIGQYHFPAQFNINNYVMTVEKPAEGTYHAHHTDFMAVQKHAVLYRNSEDGTSCEKFVAKNGHFHRIIVEDGAITGFVPVDENFADNGDPIDMEGELAEILNTIFNEYAEFFNIPCDRDVVEDADFLGDAQHTTYNVETVLGGEEPEPTDEPVPTDEPEPEVPETGMISFAGLGIAAIIGGAAIIASRKRS